MANYEVNLVIEVDNVETFAAAAKEAWAQIITTIMEGKGATCLLVRESIDECPEGEHDHPGVIFDMEIPWRPEILHVSAIEKDNPVVWGPADTAEADKFDATYAAAKAARDGKRRGDPFENLFRSISDAGNTGKVN